MVRYNKRILNALLDSYENSLLFNGENKVNIRISFPFSPKTIPEYFDESSMAYEEIHTGIKMLEQKGYVQIVWKKDNHIIQKVILNEKAIQEIYFYLERVPKAENIRKTLQLLRKIQCTHTTPICSAFLEYLINRILQGKSVKEYIELNNLKKIEQLVFAIAYIENNKTGCYIREFSIKYFGDSKVFESLLSRVAKVIHRFDKRFAEMDIYAILSEYSIYHTPNYVYFKGNGILHFDKSCIDLESLKQGIGISGEDLSLMKIEESRKIKRVITIENLTTFFRWSEKDSLIIYLGGYHNSVRRGLLKVIYTQIPEAEYLHFGDIDVGGFEIYEDLCKKTGIPFNPYYMDLSTLKNYERYAKKLTANDKIRIAYLQDKIQECAYLDVLSYMLKRNIKLEQECIAPEWTST